MGWRRNDVDEDDGVGENGREDEAEDPHCFPKLGFFFGFSGSALSEVLELPCLLANLGTEPAEVPGSHSSISHSIVLFLTVEDPLESFFELLEGWLGA